MSTITKTYTICDRCGKEIKGRLIVHPCPICKKDICNECWSAEDTKTAKKKEAVLPEKKRTRIGKKKAQAFVKAMDKAIQAGVVVLPETEHLSIHVPKTPEDTYKVMILNSVAVGESLKGTILDALRAWDGAIPTSLLNEDEVKMLSGILESGK